MSLFTKAAQFARSPKGRRIAEQAKEAAGKPENRRKIEQLRSRIARKR
jgi:hypothetical protein